MCFVSDEVAPTAVHLWSPKGYGCCYSPNQDIVAGGVLGEPQRTIPPTSVDLYWVLGGSKDCPTSGFLTPTHPTNILYQIYLYMSSFFRFSFRSFSWKYFHCGLRDSSHFRFCSFMMILSSLSSFFIEMCFVSSVFRLDHLRAPMRLVCKTFVRESEAAYSQELSQTLTDFSLPYPTCMDYRKQILCFI